MFKVYDYQCQVCGTLLENVFEKPGARPPVCEEGHVLIPMSRLPAAPVTHFRFADTKLKR